MLLFFVVYTLLLLFCENDVFPGREFKSLASFYVHCLAADAVIFTLQVGHV